MEPLPPDKTWTALGSDQACTHWVLPDRSSPGCASPSTLSRPVLTYWLQRPMAVVKMVLLHQRTGSSDTVTSVRNLVDLLIRQESPPKSWMGSKTTGCVGCGSATSTTSRQPCFL